MEGKVFNRWNQGYSIRDKGIKNVKFRHVNIGLRETVEENSRKENGGK